LTAVQRVAASPNLRRKVKREAKGVVVQVLAAQEALCGEQKSRLAQLTKRAPPKLTKRAPLRPFRTGVQAAELSADDLMRASEAASDPVQGANSLHVQKFVETVQQLGEEGRTQLAKGLRSWREKHFDALYEACCGADQESVEPLDGAKALLSETAMFVAQMATECLYSKDKASKVLAPVLNEAQKQAQLPATAGGESKRLVVDSLWSQFTSECQRFGHPPRLDK
jgi:hypothetical protein